MKSNRATVLVNGKPYEGRAAVLMNGLPYKKSAGLAPVRVRCGGNEKAYTKSNQVQDYP